MYVVYHQVGCQGKYADDRGNTMTVPYTYLIKCVPTGEVYYGVKFAKNCHPSDLWTTYYTSSKIVMKRIEIFGLAAFNIEIRRTFIDGYQARIWENTVLRRMKAITNPKWLNNSNGVAFNQRKTRDGQRMVYIYSSKKFQWLDFDVAMQVVNQGLGILKGPSKSTDFRQKISNKLKGKRKPRTT